MPAPPVLLKDRYKLVRKIGKGGFATVYEALDTTLGKKVAVKLLSPRHADRDDLRKRFIQEAKSAAKLRHHLLVDVTDVGETDDGLPFFVMEYLEGCAVNELIRSRPDGIPWQHVVAIVTEVVKALEVAHQQGIVHRDVKPGNVFLKGGVQYGPDLQVKLLDLGIAKVHTDVADDDMPETRESQGPPGTPEYMAPEQIWGGAKGPSIDIYAVGVLMYRLLTGTLPFASRSPYEVMRMHREDPPDPPSSRTKAEFPAEVEALVLHLMEKDPLARPASATAVRLELERLSPAATASATETAAPAHRTRTERLLRVFRAVMVLSIAALTIFFFALFLELESPAAAQAVVTAPPTLSPTRTSPQPQQPPEPPEREEEVVMLDVEDTPDATTTGDAGDSGSSEDEASPSDVADISAAIDAARDASRSTTTRSKSATKTKDPKAALRKELSRLPLNHCSTSELKTSITLSVTADLEKGAIAAEVIGPPSKKGRCVKTALEQKQLKTRGEGSVRLTHRVEV